MNNINVGDTFTMDVPDRRWRIRVWCWICGMPLPMVRKAYRVTHLSPAGGLAGVR